MKENYGECLRDRLQPAPRKISKQLKSVITRGRFRMTDGVAYLLAFGCMIAGFYLVSGMGNPSSVVRSLGLLLLVLGLGLPHWINRKWKQRVENQIKVLSLGKLHQGFIASAFDHSVGAYRPFSEILKEWDDLPAGVSRSQGMGASLVRWPVQIVMNHDPSTDKIIEPQKLDTKMNLKAWFADPKRTNIIHFLVPASGFTQDIIILDNEKCIAVDDQGLLTAGSLTNNKRKSNRELITSLRNALLVVVPTYTLTAYGVVTANSSSWISNPTPPIPAAFFTLLFTLTHGVIPVLFYRLFTGGSDSDNRNGRSPNPVNQIATGIVILHMILWYGVPIIGLAVFTDWYSLAWFPLHICFAGKHHRKWVYLEHGSTSMALCLFLVNFAGSDLFPTGIVVVILQSLLLTFLEWRVKPLWNENPKKTN